MRKLNCRDSKIYCLGYWPYLDNFWPQCVWIIWLYCFKSRSANSPSFTGFQNINSLHPPPPTSPNRHLQECARFCRMQLEIGHYCMYFYLVKAGKTSLFFIAFCSTYFRATITCTYCSLSSYCTGDLSLLLLYNSMHANNHIILPLVLFHSLLVTFGYVKTNTKSSYLYYHFFSSF